MLKSKIQKYKDCTIGEIFTDIFIRYMNIIVSVIIILASIFLYNKFSEYILIDYNSTGKDISTSFIAVCGILPGLLISFSSTIMNLPENNMFVENLQKTGYDIFINNNITTCIYLLIINLFLNIGYMLFKDNIILFIGIVLMLIIFFIFLRILHDVQKILNLVKKNR